MIQMIEMNRQLVKQIAMNNEYIPDGLIFSNYEDFLVDIDSESEDERLRLSFPKDRKQKPIIPGGPQPPVLLNYHESECAAVWGKYVKERKKYVDNECHKQLKAKKFMTKGGSNLSGDQTKQLCPMSKVEKTQLSIGHTF